MLLPRIGSNSPMNLHIMPAVNRQSPQVSQNPMDLCTMLNTPDEASKTPTHNIIKSTVEPDSPICDCTENNFQFPPLQSAPMGHDPPRPTYQLPPLNLEQLHLFESRKAYQLSTNIISSPQDANFSPQDQTPFSTFYPSYPTPPPSLSSSPRHSLPDHPQFPSESVSSNRQHKHHFSTTKSRASLSHRRRTQQKQQTSWNIPLHHISTQSPPYNYTRPHLTPSDQKTHYDTLASQHSLHPKPKLPHSNKPYTREQVMWIRYHREDLNLPWPVVLKLFTRRFPEYARLSVPCLSSRYYRDNKVPMLDPETEEVVLDESGKVVMVPCKVRGRNSKEGKEVPYLFIDRHPECAMMFEWVSREDRERAERILRGLEEEGEMSEWKRHQQILRKLDSQSQELMLRFVQKGGPPYIT